MQIRLDEIFLHIGSGMKVMMRLTGGKTKTKPNPAKTPASMNNTDKARKTKAKKRDKMKSVWLPLPFDFLGLNLHLLVRLDGIPATKEAFMSLMSALYDLLVSQM